MLLFYTPMFAAMHTCQDYLPIFLPTVFASMLTRQTVKEVMIIAIKIQCPVCANKRLFDLVCGRDGELLIKCPRCKSIIDVSFINNRIMTRHYKV